MAHKKGAGTSKNGRDSAGQRLGVKAFGGETVTESEPRIVISFDTDTIDGYLDEIRDEVEDEPVDARFEIDGDEISISPGESGTVIDAAETAQRLADAGRTIERVGLLPLVEGAEPEVTTEYLESLEINHLVSSFTTYYDCCQDRVVNIHTIADAVDGTIVLPGETFSLNGHVGERTARPPDRRADGVEDVGVGHRRSVQKEYLSPA